MILFVVGADTQQDRQKMVSMSGLCPPCIRQFVPFANFSHFFVPHEKIRKI